MEKKLINFRLHPTILNQEIREIYTRDQFRIPDGCIYLDGNSLGPRTVEGNKCLQRVNDEWGDLLIGGWMNGKIPWFYYPETLAGMLAPLLGAEPNEVSIQNATTINLHLLLASFYKPKKGKKRNVIVIEEGAFPSDEYAVEGFIRLKNLNPKECLRTIKRDGNFLLPEDAIVEAMQDDVAIILLSSVLYQSGQLLNMSYLTEKAREKGILIGFDCSHSAGIVDHNFSEIGLDFAIFPTYKWLNGGPGSVAGLYVNKRHENKKPGLPGWFGSNKQVQFDMSSTFTPAQGAGKFQVSTSHLLSMAPLEGSLRMYENIGISAIRNASLGLTEYMIYLLDRQCPELEIVTPRNPDCRGGAISFSHVNAAGINMALQARGIIGDYRRPNIVRLAPNPLYVDFVDVYETVKVLEEIMTSAEYLNYSNERQLVA
ncbi:MAG: kynureninase [Candidatus Pacebacteria bacterium]|nr:kynureninase [Candidatus Paceibacterota bacterium]